VLRFVPALATAVTDLIVAVVVMPLLARHQPPGEKYPIQVVIYQIAMLGLALLLATPLRWTWLPTFLLLIAGVILAEFSIGILYVPTAALGGWVMVRRIEETPPGAPSGST